ncbi:MAG: 3-deoxy-7-phosphoheptulonate synthase [Gammaproteobacteria bacterium]
MYVVLKPDLDPEAQNRFIDELKNAHLEVVALPGLDRRAFALVGPPHAAERFASHPYVEELIRDEAPYKRVARALHPHDTLVSIGSLTVGGDAFVVIGGPCAVETPEQMQTIASQIRAAGAHGLRGGAYKPRSSPYSFQGHGIQGLVMLSDAGSRYGLPVVSEIMDAQDLPHLAAHVQALQVGARNMQNFSLLKTVGSQTLPVILKRGLSATLEELLLAAEYIVNAGNDQVILCERGIRTFETATRNTLDLNAVAWLKNKTHLPVLVDPSHGTGLAELVPPLSKAALAVGADGLLIEVHPDPTHAWSDGRQSLTPEAFSRLMRELRSLAEVIGRHMP